MYPPPAPATATEIAALGRLIAIAGSDTGQAGRVVNFLLAWWNAARCGGFDLTDLWAVDRAIAGDMQIVFGLVGRIGEYPPHCDPALDAAFRAIVRDWRPELAEGQT